MQSTAVQLLHHNRRGRMETPRRQRHEIVCPFCGHSTHPDTPDDAETAYCKHVVGFTDDKRWMEARVLRPGPLGYPVEYVGKESRMRVRATDVLVAGVSYTYRVYRRGANAPETTEAVHLADEPPDDAVEVPTKADQGAMLALMEEQRAVIRELQDRIRALEGHRRPPLDDDEENQESP